MAKRKLAHRNDEITSYLSESLEPEARKELEAHLDTCEECQSEKAAQEALFSEVNEVLSVKPKRTIDEQVARFEKIVAAEHAARRLRLRGRLRWGIPLGVALAAGVAAAAVIAWHGDTKRPQDTVYAPRPPGK